MSEFETCFNSADKVLIVQAENPDGDSLSSSLALEGIAVNLKKQATMYCAISMPDHLKHLPGWDRVTNEVSIRPDIVIIVDATTSSLLSETLASASTYIKNVPIFVIDHHDSENDLTQKAISLVDTTAVATGEIIYNLAVKFSWPLDKSIREMLASSILYDSLGLMTESTTAKTIRTIAQLVEDGVSLTELDDRRRQLMVRDADLTKYKGELLSRLEFGAGGQVCFTTIPWEEIEQYSARYNPPMLIIDDMRLTRGVKVAVVYKTYPDGKITAKIRSNYGYPWAKELAQAFGGGGHNYAAGFKLTDKNISEVIAEVNAWVEAKSATV